MSAPTAVHEYTANQGHNTARRGNRERFDTTGRGETGWVIQQSFVMIRDVASWSLSRSWLCSGMLGGMDGAVVAGVATFAHPPLLHAAMEIRRCQAVRASTGVW